MQHSLKAIRCLVKVSFNTLSCLELHDVDTRCGIDYICYVIQRLIKWIDVANKNKSVNSLKLWPDLSYKPHAKQGKTCFVQ